MSSFMPTKEQWDALTKRAAHMERELAAIRNLFAHLAPNESMGVYELCEFVLRLHSNQAATIESLKAKQQTENL